ncbi:MAG: DUF2092 domain-containing protein [Desulfobacterales bacterium]|jgi:hypothetical protein|nr:DUF2092 domain-containing protein [Desulfobacterales bacterium]
MKRFALKMFFLIGVVLWLPLTSAAADSVPSKGQSEPGDEVNMKANAAADMREPAAIAELKRATDFLTSLPRFHIKASVAYDVVQTDGRILQFEKKGDLYLQRPDRFFADIQFDDGRRRQCWYDGKMLSLAERSKKVHTRIKAPPAIDATLDMLEGLLKEPQPLADLFYSDLRPLDQLAIEADVVGDSLVNGLPCKQLSFRGKTVDWQIWIEQGTTPFIRKLAISYREQPGTPQSVALLTVWEVPERFSDSLFTFTAPADSQWIDILVPMPRKTEKGGRP